MSKNTMDNFGRMKANYELKVRNNLNKNSEHGAVMVEASIYFPLVLCTVMAMIYLGLFHMQESAMLYQAERIAAEIAREEAYPGYEAFGMNNGNNTDFSWGGNMPPEETVNAYFTAHHNRISDLYREIFGLFRRTGETEAYFENKYALAAEETALIGIGTVGAPEVEIERGLFGSSVTVTITHRIPVPGVIRYLGIADDFTLESRAEKSIINPGEFVRNVDLAVDLTDYLLKKLDPGGTVKGFIGKTQDILNKIL